MAVMNSVEQAGRKLAEGNGGSHEAATYLKRVASDRTVCDEARIKAAHFVRRANK